MPPDVVNDPLEGDWKRATVSSTIMAILNIPYENMKGLYYRKSSTIQGKCVYRRRQWTKGMQEVLTDGTHSSSMGGIWEIFAFSK
jgi:hypothetical protein